MARRIIYFSIVSFFIQFSFAQQKRFSGLVKSNLNIPLKNAVLIVSAKEKASKLLYTTTDNRGYYTINLKESITYTFTVSYLGYKDLIKEVILKNEKDLINFTLIPETFSLDEIVLDYKYKAIEKNKDTITYNLKAFTNGNEFKMKDVLDKLPGIKVDENTIKIKGKTVTKLLVEGKPFFDGGTKLAIENIPADVMAKIEIISNYKESELLRNLANNEDLALNVILKEDKKDFAFGDIEAGLDFNKFYSLHTAFFKYNPKSNISFIGDINNLNNSSLSFSDLSRLLGRSSNLFNRANLSNNLSSFASNNKERFKSTTRFSALNFQHEFNDAFNISGYAIYSNNDILNKSLSIREYLGDQPIIETRNDFENTDNSSALFNIKLDYNPSANQKWMYSINYLHNASDYSKESISSVQNTNQFFTNVNGNNGRFSHNLEGYFKLNDKHTMGVALFHSIINSNSIDNWLSNAVFLEKFLPLTKATNYKINQINNIKTQSFNILIKDYWLTSRYYHLFYNVGFNYKESRIKNDISQVLIDNSTVNFSNIGNNNPLMLSDLNFGLGIKTKLGKLEFVLEAKPHYFKFDRAQIKDINFFIEPKLNINYKIDDDIDLDFEYMFTNKYLNDLNYLKNLKITGFNSIIQGNPNLTDERSHNFSLYYSNYKNTDTFFIDASIDYSVNNPVKNKSIIQSGITQISTPVILNSPEENISFNTNFGLIFNKSSLEFGVDLDWLKINQIINQEVNTINSFEYSLSSKWLLKLSKKTQLNLKYKHNGYQVNSDENSRSSENIFSLNFDNRFLNNFIFKTDFSSHFVNDFSNNTQNYTLQNLYLGYTKPNSKFSYSLNFKNIYNNGVIITNSFSNNLLISNQIFTLPRVFLIELKYKF